MSNPDIGSCQNLEKRVDRIPGPVIPDRLVVLTALKMIETQALWKFPTTR
jgi:hypothetical protein